MYAINKFINIRKDAIFENGTCVYQNEDEGFSAFMKKVYKERGLAYPKFYKMDDLCKLAFMAAELLLEGENEKDIALLLSNREASLDTDLKHQQTIQDAAAYFPSPAVFVYTLPNITIGEISIRHGLKSESAFFIADRFPAERMQQYAEYLLNSKKAQKVLCGWIHFLNGEYRADFYLVDSRGLLTHTMEHINEITK